MHYSKFFLPATVAAFSVQQRRGIYRGKCIIAIMPDHLPPLTLCELAAKVELIVNRLSVLEIGGVSGIKSNVWHWHSWHFKRGTPLASNQGEREVVRHIIQRKAEGLCTPASRERRRCITFPCPGTANQPSAAVRIDIEALEGIRARVHKKRFIQINGIGLHGIHKSFHFTAGDVSPTIRNIVDGAGAHLRYHWTSACVWPWRREPIGTIH